MPVARPAKKGIIILFIFVYIVYARCLRFIYGVIAQATFAAVVGVYAKYTAAASFFFFFRFHRFLISARRKAG